MYKNNKEFFDKLYLKVDRDIAEQRERAFSRMVKIQEELGELAEQVHTKFGIGRQEKLDNFKQENLENELGDVFITLIMLAKVLEINPEKALNDKIKKMKGVNKC